MQYQAYMHMHGWPWVVNPSEVLKTVIHHEIIISQQWSHLGLWV